MKKLILPILLLFSVAATAAPSIFFDGTWEQARAKAKKENKYIFLDCWTEWCGYCKMMDNETFVDSAVMEFMNKNFVSVSRDMERGEGRLLNMKYHTQGYPTYYIFTPNGEMCYQLIGYKKPQPWIDTLRFILKPENQHVCTGFSDKLEPGYPDFYKNSFGVKDDKKFADSAEVASWINKQKDWSSEVCWSVMWFYKGSFEQQQWMFENGQKLYALYGPQVWDAISSALSYRAYRADTGGNEAEFERLLTDAEKYLPEPYRTERIYYSRSYHAERHNQWKEYTVLSDSFFKLTNYKNIPLNDVAWKIYENTTDTAALNIALKWIKIELHRDSAWYVHDTYAVLLFATGTLDEAERQANIAIELAGKEGDTAESTRELLAKIEERRKQK